MLKKIRDIFFYNQYVASVLTFLPGLIILFFSMAALHTSLRMSSEQKELFSFFEAQSNAILVLEEKYHNFEIEFTTYMRRPTSRNADIVKQHFKSFTDTYFNLSSALIESSATRFFREYGVLFNEISGDITKASDIVYSLDTPRQADNLRQALAEVKILHRKIENMWVLLFSPQKIHRVTEHINQRGRRVYWSIIAVGLSGFVLIILNTNQLRELKAINTEKKKALKLLENRMVALESTFDGIGIVDEQGTLTYMNKALRKLHGLTEKEAQTIIGTSWKNLYVEKGRRDIEENVMPLLLQKGYWRGESIIALKDGGKVWADLSLTGLPGGGFIGTARDISDRKKAQEEKDALQDQFFQAQKMEAIGRLAGGIAHDFNNILAAMNGYAEFLVDDLEEGSPQHKFAQNILQAGLQARHLVDQMLAFSRRKETGEHSLNLTGPVKESLSMLQASMPKRIQIESALNVDKAFIKGNNTQITQVIMNLCVNAKDAISPGRGTIKVALEKADDTKIRNLGITGENPAAEDLTPPIHIEEPAPGRVCLVCGGFSRDDQYICLSIEDTGSGMRREIMEHIFEPFFTTKPVNKGTGLGLSTVHGVMMSHKGIIVIESKYGKGTRFELYFPLTEPDKAHTENRRNKAVDNIRARILLVDDQDQVRDMTLTMLERLGFEAAACVSGAEALEVLEDNPGAFDLVITDHNMPEMTGMEFVQKASQILPDMPFIMLSGYGEEKIENITAGHPAVKMILRKPASKDALADKIYQVLFSEA